MVKGYWDKRFDKACESIYLLDRDNNIAYSFEIIAHEIKGDEQMPSTDINLDDPLGVLRGLAEALQMGGYIPKAATDAELKATKYHLEDFRKLAFDDLREPE